MFFVWFCQLIKRGETPSNFLADDVAALQVSPLPPLLSLLMSQARVASSPLGAKLIGVLLFGDGRPGVP